MVIILYFLFFIFLFLLKINNNRIPYPQFFEKSRISYRIRTAPDSRTRIRASLSKALGCTNEEFKKELSSKKDTIAQAKHDLSNSKFELVARDDHFCFFMLLFVKMLCAMLCAPPR